MIIRKQTRDKYRDSFDNRYDKIMMVLKGSQATIDDAEHGIKGPVHWLAEILDASVIIDELDLTLAIDDLMAILKELKKLK